MKITEAERKLFQKLGRKGGKKRATSQTAEERSALARKAVNARWAKVKAEGAA